MVKKSSFPRPDYILIGGIRVLIEFSHDIDVVLIQNAQKGKLPFQAALQSFFRTKKTAEQMAKRQGTQLTKIIVDARIAKNMHDIKKYLSQIKPVPRQRFKTKKNAEAKPAKEIRRIRRR